MPTPTTAPRRAAALLPLPALVALLAAATPARAQTSRADPTDFQSWYGSRLRLDLPRRWEASLQYRLRLVDNSSLYRGSYATGEVGYSPAKRVSLFGSYRLAAVDEGTFHRYAAGAEAGRKLRATTLSLRTMVQYQKQNFAGNDETSSDEDTFLRTRVEAKRPLSKALDVYASTEPYFKLGEGSDYPVDNWRNTLGLKWAYAKGRKVDLFYIYRPDYGKRYNRTFHVVGVDLDFDVKVRGRGK
jgi:hypothetical protein